MTDEQQELTRRAVACKAWWRWVPGVLTQFGRIYEHPSGEVVLSGRAWRMGDIPTISDLLPDLTDPATLGCLLALVRKAWGDEGVSATRDAPAAESPTRWWVCLSNDAETVIGHGPTEAHALVAALEAAP